MISDLFHKDLYKASEILYHDLYCYPLKMGNFASINDPFLIIIFTDKILAVVNEVRDFFKKDNSIVIRLKSMK